MTMHHLLIMLSDQRKMAPTLYTTYSRTFFWKKSSEILLVFYYILSIKNRNKQCTVTGWYNDLVPNRRRTIIYWWPKYSPHIWVNSSKCKMRYIFGLNHPCSAVVAVNTNIIWESGIISPLAYMFPPRALWYQRGLVCSGVRLLVRYQALCTERSYWRIAIERNLMKYIDWLIDVKVISNMFLVFWLTDNDYHVGFGEIVTWSWIRPCNSNIT